MHTQHTEREHAIICSLRQQQQQTGKRNTVLAEICAMLRPRESKMGCSAPRRARDSLSVRGLRSFPPPRPLTAALLRPSLSQTNRKRVLHRTLAPQRQKRIAEGREDQTARKKKRVFLLSIEGSKSCRHSATRVAVSLGTKSTRKAGRSEWHKGRRKGEGRADVKKHRRLGRTEKKKKQSSPFSSNATATH